MLIMRRPSHVIIYPVNMKRFNSVQNIVGCCVGYTDTWAHFIRNPEEVEWPLHIPMTKAAVRAMDTLQTYAYKHLKIQVSTFAFAVPRSFKSFVYLLYYMKILQIE